MRSTRVLFLLAAAFLTQSVMAQGPPAGTPSLVGEFQAQLDALAAQVQALEDNAPNSSIAGRTYCQTTVATRLTGNPILQGTSDVTNVFRRITDFFPDGSFTATLVSAFFALRINSLGIVSWQPISSAVDITGTYTQDGTRLDILSSNDGTPTLYVSADGSVIRGHLILFTEIGDLDQAVNVEHTLVEIDPTEALCLGDTDPDG